MKKSIKKIVTVLFLMMFSLSSFGMIDSAHNRKIVLTDGIEVRESVKQFIEINHIPLEEVLALYHSILDDTSNYGRYEKIIIGQDKLIRMNILKRDHSIVDIYLLETNNL
jgi:hypothetical protein